MSTTIPSRRRRSLLLTTAAVSLAMALAVASCSSSDGDGNDGDGAAATGTTGSSSGTGSGAGCPTEVDAEEFASADELRGLLAEFNDFGLRSPASDQHEAAIDWLADQLGEVPGMEVEFDEYTIDRWQPTPMRSIC